MCKKQKKPLFWILKKILMFYFFLFILLWKITCTIKRYWYILDNSPSSLSCCWHSSGPWTAPRRERQWQTLQYMCCCLEQKPNGSYCISFSTNHHHLQGPPEGLSVLLPWHYQSCCFVPSKWEYQYNLRLMMIFSFPWVVLLSDDGAGGNLLVYPHMAPA